MNSLKSLAFAASSTVTKGRSTGIVIKTALNTEIGKIAKSLKSEASLISRDKSNSFGRNLWITSRDSPRLRSLESMWVTPCTVKLSRMFNIEKQVAIYAICFALSMIPSSLVVVLTINMSANVKVIATRHVIIRKLDSSEALGAVNYICSDKTEDASIITDFKSKYYAGQLGPLNVLLFDQWLYTAKLANIATVFRDPETQDRKAHGDLSEIAIPVFATRMDLPRRVLTAFAEEDLKTVQKNVDILSSEGLRVLAFTKKTFNGSDFTTNKDKLLKERDFVENNPTLLGLVGIYYPPRCESLAAVKKYHVAGINVHVLTSDFPVTAKSIAQEVGILFHNLYHYQKKVIDFMVMAATDFDSLSDGNFTSILNAVEEGRRMSDNIQKFVRQLLTENMVQDLYLIVGLCFLDKEGLSVFPLSSVEVSWVIVLNSCFPAMGLSLEKANVYVTEEPPKDAKVDIFT